MKKKRELTEAEKQNETYYKIVATVVGIPYQEPTDGFTQTNFQAPDEEEVYLKGIIHDNSIDEFHLFVHGSTGRCFLIAAQNEIRKFTTTKLNDSLWSCPIELLRKYLPIKGGSIILESTLNICKAFQAKYPFFGKYSVDETLPPVTFSKYVRSFMHFSQLLDLIDESMTILSPAQVLSTFDSKFEQRVKMDGKTYTVFDATAK